MKIQKLLGIPISENSTEMAQHGAIVKLLKSWEVFDKVIGLVFDTTASNTGRIKGCATTVEETLERAVLWFACRHHMYEIRIKHVSDEVIGKRNSPSESLFVRFQKEWKNFDQDKTVGLFLFSLNGHLLTFLFVLKSEFV